jgi:plastocyanin
MSHSRFRFASISAAALCLCLAGCNDSSTKAPQAKKTEAPPSYFKVDPATAGTISGTVNFTGKRPAAARIDMSEDPACMQARKGKTYESPVSINAAKRLANVFIYVKTGLEGKTFQTPSAPVTIDQNGCWFRPRVLGIQTGQQLQVTNSDPVTHNIHPMAQINREWNHSQGEGDGPLERKFIRPEVMIRVKCNIHNWMHAYIGVVEHPYFAVTPADGSFELPNLPPGDYTLEAWHETLGTQQQKITVGPSGKVQAGFTFKGE